MKVQRSSRTRGPGGSTKSRANTRKVRARTANSKLTTQRSQLPLRVGVGNRLLTHSSPLPLRIGFGNDVHALVPDRELILGGVKIPFDKGPAGHSDGDALAHALTDALLGAAALGDIGTHFPDDSPKWRGASSLIFLEHTRRLLDRAGFCIVNVDATVSLERPKLRPHIPAMRSKIAKALGIKASQVSVKAKTGEGLDSVGRGEAIRADAVALLSTSSKF